MNEKQPDYKKSKNDPYDLNTPSEQRDSVPAPVRPSPYDLDKGTPPVPDKDKK